jgi:uncharacterized protein with NRDE domain
MCLILVVWRAQPGYPLVLAANRDEFHARPTAPAAWWAGEPGILAGRDLEAGGTWLGFTRAGRFAALTNYRDPALIRTGVPSRGGLVTEVLRSGASVAASLAWLHAEGPRHNPFNLIFSDGERLGIYESVRRHGAELGPGLYGLSNHLLDTPWPKVTLAKSRLAAALEDPEDEAAILRLLRDAVPAPDAELPQTGITLEWERMVSSAFVRARDYGTRCSTLVRIAADGGARFDEWSWDPNAHQTHRVSERFALPTSSRLISA